MRNIGVFTTTRAEFGILSALIREIDKSKELNCELFVGGMHLKEEYGNTIGDLHSMDMHHKTYLLSNFYEDVLSKILMHILRFQLEDKISPAIITNKNDNITDSLQPLSTVTTKLVANNLIGFLWLQFAKSIKKSEINSKCQNCNTWFVPERKTNLLERIGDFCSSSCRRSVEHIRSFFPKSFRETITSKKPFGNNTLNKFIDMVIGANYYQIKSPTSEQKLAKYIETHAFLSKYNIQKKIKHRKANLRRQNTSTEKSNKDI